MNNTKLDGLSEGNVLGVVTGIARAASREEWNAQVDKAWPDVVAELSSNAGYIGVVALWNSNGSEEVSIVGVWETMEHRLAYEARSATRVRAIFNGLLVESPSRYKQVVTKASWR